MAGRIRILAEIRNLLKAYVVSSEDFSLAEAFVDFAPDFPLAGTFVDSLAGAFVDFAPDFPLAGAFADFAPDLIPLIALAIEAFLRATLLRCSNAPLAALSKAEINILACSRVSSPSLDSKDERNFFSKVLSLLFTARFRSKRAMLLRAFFDADLVFAISSSKLAILP